MSNVAVLDSKVYTTGHRGIAEKRRRRREGKMVARQSFRGTVPVYQQKSLLQPSAWLASVSECLVQVLA